MSQTWGLSEGTCQPSWGLQGPLDRVQMRAKAVSGLWSAPCTLQHPQQPDPGSGTQPSWQPEWRCSSACCPKEGSSRWLSKAPPWLAAHLPQCSSSCSTGSWWARSTLSPMESSEQALHLSSASPASQPMFGDQGLWAGTRSPQKSPARGGREATAPHVRTWGTVCAGAGQGAPDARGAGQPAAGGRQAEEGPP